MAIQPQFPTVRLNPPTVASNLGELDRALHNCISALQQLKGVTGRWEFHTGAVSGMVKYLTFKDGLVVDVELEP